MTFNALPLKNPGYATGYPTHEKFRFLQFQSPFEMVAGKLADCVSEVGDVTKTPYVVEEEPVERATLVLRVS